MAKTGTNKRNTNFLLNKEIHEKLIRLVTGIMTEHSEFAGAYHNKMEWIDKQYARFTSTNADEDTGIENGQGIDAATTPIGVVNMGSIVPPLVVSQVDTAVAYLAEVFLSGSPMFPVVSSPADIKDAEALEALMDDHATMDGTARQLLIHFKDCLKYNLGPLYVEWVEDSSYEVGASMGDLSGLSINPTTFAYNSVRRLCPYNFVFDRAVAAGDLASRGDYAGFIERISYTKFKADVSKGSGFVNIGKVSKSGATEYYKEPPEISRYVSNKKAEKSIDYAQYIGVDVKDRDRYGDYERLTLFIRLIPAHFGIITDKPNTPQIWKLVVMNYNVIIQAERVINAFDLLPILCGQPIEDGMDYQTPSLAESIIPFQESSATLINIRFNAARRAVADRAIYDSDVLDASDVNSSVAAAKIPMRSKNLTTRGRSISEIYYQIPFNAQGTEQALQDALRIMEFSKDVTGINNAMRGQFQPGNKSVQEWNDTMGNADGRLRLLALAMEYQIFYPLKQIMKLNIFQYGKNVSVYSHAKGESIDVDIGSLRQKVLNFKLADGYTPRARLASTESVKLLMDMINQSAVLQERLGGALPLMFMHFAQLVGVKGFDKYIPQPTVPSLPQEPQQ